MGTEQTVGIDGIDASIESAEILGLDLHVFASGEGDPALQIRGSGAPGRQGVVLDHTESLLAAQIEEGIPILDGGQGRPHPHRIPQPEKRRAIGMSEISPRHFHWAMPQQRTVSGLFHTLKRSRLPI
jgi:hypothetical protein